MKFAGQSQNEKKKKWNSSSVKVVYISSPMKVTTTASRFRTLVQQLTGRDSDITKSMDIVELETCNNFNGFEILPQNDKKLKSLIPNDDQDQVLQCFSSPLDRTHDSPTSSESLIEQHQTFGGMEPFVSSEVEDEFLHDFFSSSLFFDQYSQARLFECYDTL